ncbi:unnamed protein product [Caenorhabditis brenneri]
MPRGPGWAGEQRDARRVQNQRPAEEGRRPDGNPISVAKHVSGKLSLYMLFLRRIGIPRFNAAYRTMYNQNIEQHKAEMTKWWHAWQIDPDSQKTYEAYKKEVTEHNKNKSLVSKTKHDKSRRIREQRHRNAECFESCRSEHLRAQEESQNRSTIEISRDIDHIYVNDDLDAFCRRKISCTRSNMNSYFKLDRLPNENPLCRDEFMIHLVSVMPYGYKVNKRLKNVSCYPAEVSITTFSLMRGIVRNASKIVKMDFPWFYPDGNLEDPVDTRPFYTSHSGLDENESIASAEYPYEVFAWLQKQIDSEPNARILCNQKQFVFVYYGLYTMAVYTGHNAKRYFNDVISAKLLSIQDFTEIVLEFSTLNKPGDPWDASMIENQFLQNPLPRQDLDLFCEFHEQQPFAIKCHCTKARNAQLMHNFFKILKANRLQGFEYIPPVHELCIVDSRTTLPATLEAPNYTRAQVSIQSESAPVLIGGYADEYNEDEEEEEDYDDDDGQEEEEDNDDDEIRLGSSFGGNHNYPSASNNRLANISEFNPNRPSPRARDLESPSRSPVRNNVQQVGRNENQNYGSYGQEPNGQHRDQAPFRHNHDQQPIRHYSDRDPFRQDDDRGTFRHNDDRGLFRHHSNQVPSRYNDNQGPSRYNDNQGPSRYNGDHRPSRYSDNQGPSRYNGDQMPSRYSGDQDPNRYSGDQAFVRHYRDQGPLRHNGYDVRNPEQNTTENIDPSELRQSLRSEISEILSPTDRLKSPDPDDWETPQIFVCKSRAESEEYIKIARKGTTRQFKPINLDD